MYRHDHWAYGRDGYPPAAGCPRSGCPSRGARPSRAQASIAQFGSHDSRQSGDHPFRNGGCKQATMRIGRRQCSICPSGCVAKNQGLDRGAIHDHAGPHPLFLCAYGISTVRFPRLDGMLETHGVEPLSASACTASLAEGLLGYAIAQWRQLLDCGENGRRLPAYFLSSPY